MCTKKKKKIEVFFLVRRRPVLTAALLLLALALLFMGITLWPSGGQILGGHDMRGDIAAGRGPGPSELVRQPGTGDPAASHPLRNRPGSAVEKETAPTQNPAGGPAGLLSTHEGVVFFLEDLPGPKPGSTVPLTRYLQA